MMKFNSKIRKELFLHLALGVILVLIIETAWLIRGNVPLAYFFLLILAFIIGSSILDIDHIIYWLLLSPEKEESAKAKTLWQQKNWRALINLIGETHPHHYSLIFHHFYFQITLIILSIFVFTSTGSIFGRGLVFFLNLHLLTDQIKDFLTDPSHLKKWLFARMSFALPEKLLKYYLLFILLFVFGLFLLLISY